MTSEASSDVRGLGGAMGVVLVMSEASSGMGGAMSVSLVDSSDVRGLGGAKSVVLVTSEAWEVTSEDWEG